MKNDEQQLRKRFEELVRKAYNQSTYYFTDFLSMSDAAIVCDAVREVEYTLFGGADGCERVMARFGNPAQLGYEQEFPIAIIKIEPLLKKFADEFTHRDFLGALMNLGIERDVIGDILIREKTAYVFAAERIAQYIAENLDKVKHTNVKCTCMGTDEIKEAFTVNLREEEVIVPSERLDVILAKLYNMSRNQALDAFRERKVFVNGRLCENNSGSVNKGAVVALRGYGKFIYDGVKYETKKGKLSVSVRMYI